MNGARCVHAHLSRLGVIFVLGLNWDRGGEGLQR